MSKMGLSTLVPVLAATLFVFLISALPGNAQAARTYSPNDVFAGVEYCGRILDRLLAEKNIKDLQLPLSREVQARPMHVYELHMAVLSELYHYARDKKIPPPPLPVSTPMVYSPTDVFYLTRILMKHVEEVYYETGSSIDFYMQSYSDKSPSDVYQELFELFYKLNHLNGKPKVSPSEVYAHIFRAKEDLQYSLLTLSKRMDESKEENKRLLVTAIYGMHPDGTVMSNFEDDKKPSDVLGEALEVRKRLNVLRKRNKMAAITLPDVKTYSSVKPIDVFLQTQFIIAELNLLKIPMEINSTTNSAKPVSGKTPSDVYYEMKHIIYMLDRLEAVL